MTVNARMLRVRQSDINIYIDRYKFIYIYIYFTRQGHSVEIFIWDLVHVREIHTAYVWACVIYIYLFTVYLLNISQELISSSYLVLKENENNETFSKKKLT